MHGGTLKFTLAQQPDRNNNVILKVPYSYSINQK